MIKLKPIWGPYAVKASDWSLHATKVCMFFGNGADSTTVGCWDDEDDRNVFNRNDAPNDHIFLVDISLPKEIKEALNVGYNRKLYCVRGTYTHLICQSGS